MSITAAVPCQLERSKRTLQCITKEKLHMAQSYMSVWLLAISMESLRQGRTWYRPFRLHCISTACHCLCGQQSAANKRIHDGQLQNADWPAGMLAKTQALFLSHDPTTATEASLASLASDHSTTESQQSGFWMLYIQSTGSSSMPSRCHHALPRLCYSRC